MQIHHRDRGGADAWGVVTSRSFPTFSPTGLSFALADNTLLVGGANTDRVTVLERNLGGFGNWGQDEVILSPDGTSNNFGRGVAVSGSTFIVGAPEFTDPAGDFIGSVYVFEQQVTADDDGFVDADPVNDAPSGAQALAISAAPAWCDLGSPRTVNIPSPLPTGRTIFAAGARTRRATTFSAPAWPSRA